MYGRGSRWRHLVGANPPRVSNASRAGARIFRGGAHARAPPTRQKQKSSGWVYPSCPGKLGCPSNAKQPKQSRFSGLPALPGLPAGVVKSPELSWQPAGCYGCPSCLVGLPRLPSCMAQGWPLAHPIRGIGSPNWHWIPEQTLRHSRNRILNSDIQAGPLKSRTWTLELVPTGASVEIKKQMCQQTPAFLTTFARWAGAWGRRDRAKIRTVH